MSVFVPFDETRQKVLITKDKHKGLGEIVRTEMDDPYGMCYYILRVKDHCCEWYQEEDFVLQGVLK